MRKKIKSSFYYYLLQDYQLLLKIKKLNLIFRLIGIIIFLLILKQTNFIELKSLITSSIIKYILLSMVITIPFFIVKIIRWDFILKNVGINCSFRDASRIYGAGLFLGHVTPGQVGEIVRGVFLAKKGHDLSVSTGSVIIERVFDFILLFFIALPGFFIFLNVELYHIVLAIIIVLFLLLIINRVQYLKSSFITLKIIKSLISKVDKIYITYKSLLLKKKILIFLIVLTIIAYVIHLVRFYVLLLALDVQFPIFYFTIGLSLANLISLLPFTIAGLGFREFILILIFSHVGYSLELAIAFSSLILIAGYGSNLLWGFPAWVIETKN